MSCMSGSPNLNSFRDRGQVAVQLVSCWVLPPGLFTNQLRTVPKEQKGPQKEISGTGETVYIDQQNETKKKLAMAWIDYRKAYEMVPQSWIIDCLKMHKICGEVTKFIENAMENWSVELTARGQSLS